MRMSKKSAGRTGRGLLLILSGGLGFAGAGNGCVTETVVSSGDPGHLPTFATTPSGDDSGFGTAISLGIPGPFADGGGCGAVAPVPDFGTPVTCSTPTPPISGGTLLVTGDGSKAVASDPDRDAVYIVDLGSKTRTFTVSLSQGDEPGRLVEDGAGRIHVALRGSGMLATIDPTAGTVISRRAACPAPRGVAWRASSDVVLVACATGELASLPAAGGDASVQVISRDLRDVIVNGDDVSVTLFRSASVLRLAGDGSVSRTASDALRRHLVRLPRRLARGRRSRGNGRRGSPDRIDAIGFDPGLGRLRLRRPRWTGGPAAPARAAPRSDRADRAA